MPLDKVKIKISIAYCGLICDLCHLADECDGCKSENNNCGKHLSEAGCFQRGCCINKNIDGCWECDDFPCDKDMYSDRHDPKVKAFARCIREDGAEAFVDYILKNLKRGLDVRYQGDYDSKTESEVLTLLRKGVFG